ncbi:MAG: hypothetical protein E7Z92_08045 [Cyanobacteria bacterium SIG31]|nr:hypothetical protein [Cyanobacteria bacterium SIG31]
MKIQSILPTVKNNKLLIAPIAAATLALSPLNSAKAQEKATQQMNTDTIEMVSSVKSDELMYSNLSTKKVKAGKTQDLVNAEMAEIQEKEESMPFYKAFLLEIVAAVATVGIALLCAWDPNSKNNLNHRG